MRSAALRDTVSDDNGTVFAIFDISEDDGDPTRHRLTIGPDDDVSERIAQFRRQMDQKSMAPIDAKPARFMSRPNGRLADVTLALAEFPTVPKDEPKDPPEPA